MKHPSPQNVANSIVGVFAFSLVRSDAPFSEGAIADVEGSDHLLPSEQTLAPKFGPQHHHLRIFWAVHTEPLGIELPPVAKSSKGPAALPNTASFPVFRTTDVHIVDVDPYRLRTLVGIIQ